MREISPSLDLCPTGTSLSVRNNEDTAPDALLLVPRFAAILKPRLSLGRWQALVAEAGFTAAPPKRHRGCAFGDFDGDGRMDVVVSALLEPAEIWMNRTEDSGHWLDIALEGTKSNRDGIGAVIKVVTEAGAQYNHMTSSVGYASSSHGAVHFGLGEEAKAELVEIRWPSGIVQTLRNVTADRVLSVKEAAG